MFTFTHSFIHLIHLSVCYKENSSMLQSALKTSLRTNKKDMVGRQSVKKSVAFTAMTNTYLTTHYYSFSQMTPGTLYLMP